MKRLLTISSVLSWINIVFWGLACGLGLLSTLVSGGLVFAVGFFLLSSIVLHSYAALQLHKSIRNPARPLGSQTPAGIRFIGLAALFFGGVYVLYGMSILQHPKEVLESLRTSSVPQFKDLNVESIRMGGILALLLGLAIVLNVVFNFRLLRWYYQMHENDSKGGDA